MAFWARGQSAYRARDGKLAAADLTKAATYTTNVNSRGLVLNNLGDTYLHLLKDEEKAIATYRRVFKESHVYKQCHAAITLASIRLKKGKPEEALQELKRIDLKKVRGYWKAALLMARARALLAAGKKAEAIADYKQAIAIKGLPASTKKMCEKAIKQIEGGGK